MTDKLMENAVLRFQFTILVLVISFFSFAANAEIYRWTDETGKVHYSDKAPQGIKVEKKAYPNVATPWRKVPKPDPVNDDEVNSSDPSKQNGENINTESQKKEELSQDSNDKKNKKKTKRLKAKSDSDSTSSDRESGVNPVPLRLNQKDKSSSTPAKRAADIKAAYQKAKADYRKTTE